MRPELEYVSTLYVELGPLEEMGQGRSGRRRIIPITGGRVEGTLAGKIRDLGADWQTILADGTILIDTRYAFETNDGALIEVINTGFRYGPPEIMERLSAGEEVSPDAYTMRTAATLETGDPRYAWVNRTVFVGTGARRASSIDVTLWKVT